MTILARPVSDHADIYLPNVHVLHRAHPLVTLTRGFHDAEADGLGRLIRDWCPFEVLHFPNRTAAQIERKYEQAWQAWSDYPSGGGEHVHASHQTLQDEGREQLYAQRVVEGEELEDGIRRGAFVEDTRLRDAFREIDHGRPPRPRRRRQSKRPSSRSTSRR